MITAEHYAHTLEEWREKVSLLVDDVRSWQVPLSICASGTPEDSTDKRLPAMLQTDNVPGSAMLMAHGYRRYGHENLVPSHFGFVRSKCSIPAADKWICDGIRERLLEEKYAVAPQSETKITHLFHRGKHPSPELGFLSFGVRMSDEEAIEMLLRDFSGVQLMHITGGVYLGLDDHP